MIELSHSKPKIAVVGLGYVGLPLAVEFSKSYEVLGFDLDKARVASLLAGSDTTLELSNEELKAAKGLTYSINPKDLRDAEIYIVTVPTPIDTATRPDLTSLISASKTVGMSLQKGNIVIVSSAASNVKGVPNRFIYGTTKAALNGFVKAIAIDHIKDGIRCNAILPGTVETPSWEGRVNMADDPVKARSDFIARQAMGRLAQPEEIASLATYLASDESDFVTGTLNLIDGGWTL